MFKYFLPEYNTDNLIQYYEFNNPEIVEAELPPKEIGVAMSHQELISNIMKGSSPIDNMLLVHEMGTGKTCTSINAIERNIKDGIFGLSKAIVLNKGKAILGNFENELVNKCTTDYSVSNSSSAKTDKSLSKKLWSKYYNLVTFEIFAKKLEGMSDRQIIKEYNNSFIVIDEAHNIVNENGRVFSQIFRFLKVLPRRKLLLMTGTPIKDSPIDFAPILSLLTGQQFPQNDFVNRFYDNGNLTPEFYNLISGKVSYLDASKPEIKVSYVGEPYREIKKCVLHVMSEFQSTSYARAYKMDTTGKGIYNNTRQAVRFVFPDGTFGSEGFDKYVNDRKFTFTNEMINYLHKNGNSTEAILKQIKNCSTKYESLIRTILESDKKKEKSLVYDDLVKGSGLIILKLCLDAVGFKKHRLLSSETTTPSEIQKIIKIYNSSMTGERISVILGSKVIAEGFTLTDVLHEHLTPHWNSTETNQVIARGIRMGSHRETVAKRPNAIVKVYKHISVPISKPTNSVDYIMNVISDGKQMEIDKILEAIKDSSITCEAFKGRNKNDKCLLSYNGKFDTSNDPISNNKNFKIKYLLQRLFKTRARISFKELLTIITEELGIDNSEHSLMEITENIIYWINNNEPFINERGIVVNLYFAKDEVFTSVIPTDDSSLSTYTKDIRPTIDIQDLQARFNTLVIKNQEQNSGDRLVLKDHRLLEIALTIKLLDLESKLDVDKLLDSEKYKNKWLIDEENKLAIAWYGSLISKFIDITCLRKPKTKQPWNEWSKCPKKDIANVEGVINRNIIAAEQKLADAGLEFYGLKNPLSGDFCIKEVNLEEINDKRKRASGKRCINWNRQALNNVVKSLDVKYPAGTTRQEICNLIEDHLTRVDAIVEDKFCGTQNKIKQT